MLRLVRCSNEPPKSTSHLCTRMRAHRTSSVSIVARRKRPATKHGFNDATSDIAAIESWWTQNPNFNVAIQTGIELDGRLLVVLDFDPRNGGYDTKANLEASNGRLPDTVRVITGGGGEHLYFVCWPDVTLKSKLGPGIDIKWRGGYVVAPPSIHPETGKSYEWDPLHNLLEGASIAPLPQWIIDMCSKESPTTVTLPAQRAARVPIDADTVRDLRSALMSMRADDYELWVRMGLALRELGDIESPRVSWRPVGLSQTDIAA